MKNNKHGRDRTGNAQSLLDVKYSTQELVVVGFKALAACSHFGGEDFPHRDSADQFV